MKNTLKGTVELVSGTTLIDGKEKQNTQRTLVLTAYADTDYPKKVAFVAWNKVAEQLDAVSNGYFISVDFKISSREWNGKYYTEATVIDFSIINQASETNNNNSEDNDGLPF